MEKLNVPRLRFREFEGEWKTERIDNILRRSRLGGNYSNTTSKTDFPLIKMGNLARGYIKVDKIEYIASSEVINSLDKIKYGDLFFNTRNTLELVGKVAIWRNELPIAYYNSNLMLMIFDNNFFMNYRLNSREGIKRLRSLATGTTSVAAIYNKDFFKVRLSIPSLPEQQKIASFLTAVDDKIQLLSKKKELLSQYKKGVMQKIFNQEIRFKDDEGNDYPNWEEKSLGEVLTEHKSRNKGNSVIEVFSVAKHKGVINQIEHLGRSYASEDISNYKVVKPFDIIYTKSPTSDFPYGIIKQNKLGRLGVVSVLYAVLSPLNKSLGFILDCYFSSPVATYNYLNPLVQKGAKNTMNISNQDFLNGAKINLPVSENEQIKIAEFLLAIDDKINLVSQQIVQREAYKKGLLQQMFV